MQGSQLKELTHLECPVNGFPIGLPVLASHSLIVLSIEPVAIIVPSGEYATQRTHLYAPEEYALVLKYYNPIS